MRADTLVRFSIAFDDRTNGFDHNMSSGVVFEHSFRALTSSGPAIDAGISIGLPYSGSAPDLGAVPDGESIATFPGHRPRVDRRLIVDGSSPPREARHAT